MQIVGKVPNDRSCRPVARQIRPVVVAIIFGLAATASAVLPALTGGASATAFACGIGNTPTMAANRTPALLLPVTHTISADQPIGILAPQYVVGQPITFSEDLSNVLSPPPQAGLQYLWTFGDGTQAVGLTATHVFTKPGNYAVHTWYPAVAPSSGQESFDSAEIHVIAAAFSNPPVAKATASTLSIGPDGTITFSAAGSHSEDGTKLTYLWNFNDGVTNTAPVISHKFPDIPGNWIVGLTVTDAHGASSFTELHIRIFDFPQLPSASITSSLTTIGTGNTVTFDASGSTPPTAPGTPTGDQIVKYVWNFGDGTQAVTTTTPTITHRFSRAGSFNVTVEAIDSVGAPGSKSVTITVVRVQTNAGSPPWPLYGGALLIVILAVAGYMVYTNQRRRLALEAERQAAVERERQLRRRGGGLPPQPGYRSSTRPSASNPSQRGAEPYRQRPRYPGPSGE